MSAKLKGENQIRKFRQIAEKLVAEITSYKGVAGVVFIGGLARGFADKFSDIDVLVFLNTKDDELRRKICELGLIEKRRYGVDVDLEAHFLEEFKKWKWDETDKWEFSRAKIVFDPTSEIEKMFKEKLRVPKNFWVRRIVTHGEYIKWYCCPPEENIGSISECWIKRGDLMSAHYCLNYAVELLIRVVYALNKEFLPAPKWRLYHSYSLTWLPKNYKRFIKEAMRVEEFSVKDFERRLIAVRALWREILPKIERETGLTPEKITKYYVEKVLHQTIFH